MFAIPRMLATVALIPITVLGCGDSTGPARLAREYRLIEAAGKPVPAVLQLQGDPGGVLNGFRLLGRSIEFGLGNTMIFAEAHDAVTITNGGADTVVTTWSCSRSTGTVSREGRLVILHFGMEGVPGARADTLVLEGRQLVDSISIDGLRSPLRYSPGQTSPAICTDLP